MRFLTQRLIAEDPVKGKTAVVPIHDGFGVFNGDLPMAYCAETWSLGGENRGVKNAFEDHLCFLVQSSHDHSGIASTRFFHSLFSDVLAGKQSILGHLSTELCH